MRRGRQLAVAAALATVTVGAMVSPVGAQPAGPGETDDPADR